MNICIFLFQGLKSQAAKLLGSVDFLGNPLGLFNDVTEGISGLIKDGNVGGLLKNVTHGVSNSAAKVSIRMYESWKYWQIVKKSLKIPKGLSKAANRRTNKATGKRTNNDLQSTARKAEDWVIRTPQKTWDELRCKMKM